MKTTTIKTENWMQQAHQLGELFALRAKENDLAASFVYENYEDLKAEKILLRPHPQRTRWWWHFLYGNVQYRTDHWQLLRLHGPGLFHAPALGGSRRMEIQTQERRC